MDLCEKRLRDILEAMRHVSAEDHVHQVAESVGNPHQIVPLGSLPVLVQFLLDQADAQRNRLSAQIHSRLLFQVRAKHAVELLQHAQLLNQLAHSFYEVRPILAQFVRNQTVPRVPQASNG